MIGPLVFKNNLKQYNVQKQMNLRIQALSEKSGILIKSVSLNFLEDHLQCTFLTETCL